MKGKENPTGDRKDDKALINPGDCFSKSMHKQTRVFFFLWEKNNTFSFVAF